MGLRPGQDGRQGILPFVLLPNDREDVTARAGLPLVVETMRALGIDAVAREELPTPQRQRGCAPEEKLETPATLIAAGGDRVEDVRILGEDKGLERLLGRAFPSPDALLDFLGQFHDPKCWEDRPPEKRAYVPRESEGLRALDTINRELVARRGRSGRSGVHSGRLAARRPPAALCGDWVRWHRQKAGTIEHVHRVLKDGMGAGVLPSARFGANAAWFRINIFTFNVLTVLKRRALPPRCRDARPKRLRYEPFTLPGKLALHHSQLSVRVRADDLRLQENVDVRGRSLAMLDQRRAAS